MKNKIEYNLFPKCCKNFIYNKSNKHREISSLSFNYKKGQIMTNGIWTKQQQEYLDQRFTELRTELKTDIQDVTTEVAKVKTEVAEVRVEIQEVKTEITDIKQMLINQQALIEKIANKIDL